MREHTLEYYEPRARTIVFLMNARQQAGVMHVIFNALEVGRESRVALVEQAVFVRSVDVESVV